MSFNNPFSLDEGDHRLVSTACYSEDVATPLNSGGTNTRNVGPAVAGLTVSFDAPLDNYQLLNFRATIDNTGSGSFTVTNLTTGASVGTSTESWTGTFSSLSAVTFTLDQPLDASAGDIITMTSNASGGRWRNTFTTVSDIRQGTNGSSSGASMAGIVFGQTVISGSYKVQTYEDVSTGDLTLVQTDEAGARTEIASIPATWTEVPCDPDWIKEECYQEAGAATIYDNDPFLDEINSAQLATLPAGAHMRWTAPSDTLLNTLEVNGFNGTVAISWLASTGESGSQSVTFGANPQGLDLGGLSLAAGETIDFTLDSISAGQMQLTTAATSIANGWTALQNYSAFAVTSHWATRLLTSAPGVEHIVRTYEDGTLAEVDRDANTITPLASIPAEWTLCAPALTVPQINRTSPLLGSFMFGPSASSVQGMLPVTPGTVVNGAADYPLWAALHPNFVSGNDIVFPPDVQGIVLRNLGGNAAAEGQFQQNEIGSHQHGVQGPEGTPVPNGEYGIMRRATGGGTNNGTDSTPGEPDVLSPPVVIPPAGGVETRMNNRAYQLYTFVDTFDPMAVVGPIDVVGAEEIIARLDAIENAPPPGAPSYAQASLVGQNGNQANATLSLANGQIVKGSILGFTGNTVEVLQEAYAVEVFGTAAYDYDTGDTNQNAEFRVAPILEIWKNGVLAYPSANAYQRQANGHNDSSNQPNYIDLSPQIGDTYSIVCTQGGTQTAVMNITQGQFTVKAY